MKYLETEADVIPELELWYKLDQFRKNCSVYDSSKNHYNTNGISNDIFPSYPGFYFGNAGFEIGNSLETVFQSSFSISTWVKGTDNMLFGIYDGIEDRVSIEIASNKLKAIYNVNGNEATAIEASASFSDSNVYRHVGVSFEADTKIRLYVNGSERTLASAPNNGDASGITFSGYENSLNPYIGGINADGNLEDPFTGNIGDFRVYSKLLSATEVKNIYEMTRWRYSA